MAYCGNCGTKLSDGAQFCPKCGTRVSPVTNDNGGKTSSKKIVIPFVIFLLLAFIGGGYIYQQYKKEEVRKKEEIRIKAEKQKEAEELKKEKERRRIEEENKPANKFYSLINQGFVWESRGVNLFKDFHMALYFYPQNKTAGQVCLVGFNNDYTAYSKRVSGVGSYIVSDKIVDVNIEYIFSEANWEKSERFMFSIENSGDFLKAIKKNNIINDCTRKRPNTDNPIKN